MRAVGPLLLALALVLALAAPALGDHQAPGAGFPNQLPAPAPTPPETVVAAPGAAGDDGLSKWQELLILGGGLLLLAGIAYAIVSDARRRAPVKEGAEAHPGLDGPVKRNRSQKQRERARAKAKVARAQRKRNRSR